MISAGEAYYVGPGHLPVFTAGTEIVEFSPTVELSRDHGSRHAQPRGRHRRASCSSRDHDDAPSPSRIAARLEVLDFERLADLYRADALLDVSVPKWRFQLQGRDAIRQSLREEVVTSGGRGPGHRAGGSRRPPTASSSSSRSASRRTGRSANGARSTSSTPTGEAITEHVNYCTGIWDAATIARQAVEAPMVRR